ncbi:MAG: acetyl/propionyl/methylcrotonyl-CoA carboxylase subunit alpha [Minwuia sp.]|uniref:acetyl-CoA carboxylase biotin carboxylase subunit n=1 Tax=Minwuia sp. TaxID=2493630 RepID=UPI003A8599B4
MFTKVLIANRGEIACRVAKTLDRMGIESVGIYHHADRLSAHVGAVDHAVEITGATPVAAHLDAEQIIRIAKETGAEAVHPGYGFLSENAKFAEAVAAAGLAFVGPNTEAIRLMGDKIESRNFAEQHGVPVAPSVLPTGDIDAFVAEAAKIGFPLLVKASAGGGGKGMSIVREAAELAEKAKTASSEAERYFADGRVYAERYVEQPRHIEVQVLGDGAGNVIHLYERECSIQRRFQKIVEEAPAANLPPALRDEICAAAVRLAAAANYANAGTVEFILAPDGAFYFLEMNTRLQVEHPVTEMITGVDLVEQQLRIAAGEGLPLNQDDIAISGHAIECRICAEDPENDFLPETGRILLLAAPEGDGIRFENGLTEGQDVTTDFDPMLAKLVVHGAGRDEAAERMVAALEALTLLGVGTNTDYLARVIAHTAFVGGRLHTGFVAEHAEALKRPGIDPAVLEGAVVAALFSNHGFLEELNGCPTPYGFMGGWRN